MFLSVAEQYIYISKQTLYADAEQLCQERGHLHLAVMNTDERQHMFSIAMAIEYNE